MPQTKLESAAVKQVRLPQGVINYRETGTGEPLLFVHGFLVDGLLWRKVVEVLAKDFRCIVPDWPFGSHRVAMAPDADLSAPGIARIVADFMEALDLEDVTLIGNDSGGAVSQIVATTAPERLARLVLTPCDAYEVFPPKAFAYLRPSTYLPGSLALTGQALRLRVVRRLPVVFGWTAKHGLDEQVLQGWVRPARDDAAVRRDIKKIIRGLHPRHTLAAAERFAQFHKPVLLAFAPEDKFFPYEFGERMARDFPDARLERIDDSWAFAPEDQPGRVAELIAGFVREPATHIA